MKTIFAVNQLRNYGAVAKWCKNKSQDGTVESQNQDSSCIVHAQFVSHLTKHENYRFAGLDMERLVAKTNCKIQKYSREEKLAQVCREAGFTKVVDLGQYSVTKTAVLLE